MRYRFQRQVAGQGGRFAAGTHVELVEDVADVELHHVLAELQLFGDLPVAQAPGRSRQDFQFAGLSRSRGRSSGGSATPSGRAAVTVVPQLGTASTSQWPPRAVRRSVNPQGGTASATPGQSSRTVIRSTDPSMRQDVLKRVVRESETLRWPWRRSKARVGTLAES